MDAETPLLFGEGGSRHGGNGRGGEEATIPSLSSGPVEIAEETEFSRLIAQRSSSSGFHPDHQHFHDGDEAIGFEDCGVIVGNGNPLQLLSQRFDRPGGAAASASKPTRTSRAGYWVAISAATLSVLHLTFVWGSYMADVWTDTHLTVNLGGGGGYGTNFSSSLLLRSTGLSDIMQSLLRSHHYLAVAALWVTCLILPCAFMIASPSWILVDYHNHHHHNQNGYYSPLQQQQSNCNGNGNRSREVFTGRSLLELSMRFGFVVIFVFVLLDIAMSLIEISWTDTTLQIRNTPKGGLGCFGVAITSAVAFVVVKRYPILSSTKQPRVLYPTVDTANQPTQSATPPQHAFRYGFCCFGGRRRRAPSRSNHGNTRGDNSGVLRIDTEEGQPEEDEVSMAVLEDSPRIERPPQLVEPPPPPPTQGPDSSTSTPELVDEDDGLLLPGGQPNLLIRQNMCCPTRISFCYKVFIFQMGLLAVVFWMPAMYLPLLSFKYSGLASDFMTQPSTSPAAIKVYLWQVPQMIWNAGVSTSNFQDGTTRTAQSVVLAFLVVVVFVLTIFVVPSLATLLGVFTWIGEGRWVKKSHSWLFCIQPALGGLVLSFVFILFTTRSNVMGDLFESLTLNNTSNAPSSRGNQHFLLCDTMKQIDMFVDAGQGCLSLKVQLLSGAWFHMMQALLLEVFVAATLLWSY